MPRPLPRYSYRIGRPVEARGIRSYLADRQFPRWIFQEQRIRYLLRRKARRWATNDTGSKKSNPGRNNNKLRNMFRQNYDGCVQGV